ncbi:MAG: Lnb N-terminal periplasmic domain-containing protein [Methylococcaceae bacterium]
MRTFIKSFLMVLTLIGTTVWGVFAVYFGDSHSGVVQTCVALAFGLFGLLTLVCLGSSRWRKRLLTGYSILFVAILTWWFFISPSNERQWQPDVDKLAYATIDGDIVTVHNIRSFDYRSEFDYQPAYYTKTYDLNKLEGVDLFAVYWMGPAIAHTILSFNFGGNDHLAVSIEARKEQNEGYSTIKGFFRQYELIYIVADERDVIRLRANYRKNPPEDVFLYPLQGPQKNAKRLFLEYMKKINELYEKPQFYNTLLDNCTTVIWFNTRINPEHLPFSWKILLSGYVPEYLYESGRLDTRIPFLELQQQAHINSRAQAADKADDFSTRIREVSENPASQ